MIKDGKAYCDECHINILPGSAQIFRGRTLCPECLSALRFSLKGSRLENVLSRVHISRKTAGSIAVSVVTLLAASLWHFRADLWPEPEPMYAGQPLSHWVTQLGDRNVAVHAEAEAAIRAIGSEAGEVLVDLMLGEDDLLAARAVLLYAELVKNAHELDRPLCLFPLTCATFSTRGIKVRLIANAAIADLYPESRPDVALRLVDLLPTLNAAARRGALDTMAVCGAAAKPYLDTVAGYTWDKDDSVQRAATAAVRAIEAATPPPGPAERNRP